MFFSDFLVRSEESRKEHWISPKTEFYGSADYSEEVIKILSHENSNHVEACNYLVTNNSENICGLQL